MDIIREIPNKKLVTINNFLKNADKTFNILHLLEPLLSKMLDISILFLPQLARDKFDSTLANSDRGTTRNRATKPV